MEGEEKRERGRGKICSIVVPLRCIYESISRSWSNRGANSRGWAKAFLERKSSRWREKRGKDRAKHRLGVEQPYRRCFWSFFSFISLHPSRFPRDTPEASIDLLRNYSRSNNSHVHSSEWESRLKKLLSMISRATRIKRNHWNCIFNLRRFNFSIKKVSPSRKLDRVSFD